MARLIKMTNEAFLKMVIQTCFKDQSVTEREIAVGDVVENLRYVSDGEIVTVSGKVLDITYTLPSRIAFSRTKPADTFSADVTINTIKIDASEQYASKVIEVPAIEIIEDEGVENVERMKFYATVEFNMKMYYSNRSTVNLSLKVGDKVDGVKIMTSTPGVDIVGTFEILAFGYTRNSSTKFTINCIAFKNAEDDTIVVADLDKILELAEVMTYESASVAEVISSVLEARDGETVKLAGDIDATAQLINVTGKNIELDLGGKTVTVNSSGTAGLSVGDGGVLTIDGTGTIATETPYDSTHGYGVITAKDGGTLNFNGGTISAVLDDPVNNGQFGIKAVGTSAVNINGGEINTGWYGVSTHGTATNADTVITINGGKLNSASDYAVYIPKGNLVVNDGEITGAAGAISCNGGNITINGGTIKCSGGGDTGEWSDGTSGQNNAAINLNGKYSPVTCTIHGGTFISSLSADPIIVAGTTKPVTVVIDGGKFSQKPDESWIADGYLVTGEPVDGFYEVYKALQ